ncbi:MAG: ThuA domain-containing protein [Thermoguttaceae bacterium]|jgi:type 1 glutamine amidotransferase
MRHSSLWVLGVLLSAIWSGGAGAADTVADSPAGKANVLILVGGHPFDQAKFDKFWKGFDDLVCETHKRAPYRAFDDISQFRYDAIVMYNMSGGITARQKENFLKLLKRGVGLVVWHHAPANLQDWPEFEKITGARFWLAPGERNGVKVPGSGVGWGKMKMHIEDPSHPIMHGLADFTVDDETYNHQTFTKDIHVLLTTDHPASDKTIAWAHEYGKARVFGYRSGHDDRTWNNSLYVAVHQPSLCQHRAGHALPGHAVQPRGQGRLRPLDIDIGDNFPACSEHVPPASC